MSLRYPISVALALLWLCPVVGFAAEPFKICAEPNSLPLSRQADQSGLEIDVARIIADELGRELKIVWVSNRDYAFYRMTVGSGACDALMGVPASFPTLTTTNAWYRTGFMFVSRSGDVRSFDDERLRHMTIGVPVTGLGDGTPPAIALARRKMIDNLRPFSVYEPQTMVAAVAAGTLDTAVVWGPFAGWFVGAGNEQLSLARAPGRDGPTPFAFDISIGVKKGNEVLRDRLDRALGARQVDVEQALERWRVPHGKDW